jgi:hypothetical protein
MTGIPAARHVQDGIRLRSHFMKIFPTLLRNTAVVPKRPRRAWGAACGVAALALFFLSFMPATPSNGQTRARLVTKSKAAPPRRATVNFAELARREAAQPHAVRPR